MNMLGYKDIGCSLLLSLIFFSCKKEKVYVYQVNDVEISQPGVEKPNVKTNTQFISITYTDLFGSNISQSALSDLETVYLSFGDKSVIEDLIIRNFLNEAGVNLPSEQEMIENPVSFVKEAYNRLFNREPNEYESWYLVNKINESSEVTPELFYYALLTSNEYRQY